ncbi:nuclear transport factor 2 family protein [Aggregicoccus sp. 17bor-14]|uniref:nuclear transport factor 2 family protein n=1 Tax=Myxococcaceae TaxID=31 RepID=UPI00129C81DC|nr:MULTISPECIES: nuclear transport factor 2 family protein [Myxococcaceae]MBF5041562.1 nuclear transport factor 2 family protein [Simulacricoccus sp. 17bor-14]MRI87347.1 nuclear transport factor 2 family protein [Aggregicoccus sp. 17bor-14]
MNDPVLDALHARDAGWTQALTRRDVAAVADFLHPDYALMLVHPKLSVMPRAEWLGTLHGYVVSHWDEQESSWAVAGGVASHLHRVDMRAEVFGVPRNGLFVLTDTWLRCEDGAWRVWKRHSTPLSAGDVPRAPGKA